MTHAKQVQRNDLDHIDEWGLALDGLVERAR
jgi:hypothetical protein